MKEITIMNQLCTNRNGLSVLLDGWSIARDLNTIINGADGKKSHGLQIILTFGAPKVCRRINWELKRRGIDYHISGLFCSGITLLLSSMTIIPVFIFLHQVAAAMNLLCEDYNKRG